MLQGTFAQALGQVICIVLIDGWITCDFMSFSKVIQSYQDDERVLMKGCVQWTPVTADIYFVLPPLRIEPGLPIQQARAKATELLGLMQVLNLEWYGLDWNGDNLIDNHFKKLRISQLFTKLFNKISNQLLQLCTVRTAWSKSVIRSASVQFV